MGKKKEKKVYGVGVNDSPEPVQRFEKVDGKKKQVWVCPYYVVWKDMLKRCYYEPYLKKKPTYIGCSVCDDWVYFMTFKAWMMSQDFEGKHLDKDILFEGNKVYSPETCRFVEARVNTFLVDSGAIRGAWPLGVYWKKDNGKFKAQCNNPFTKKREHLGYFTDPQAAHEAWRKRKYELALALADLQTDPLIAQSLRLRFAPK